jgi:hypothetical protein
MEFTYSWSPFSPTFGNVVPRLRRQAKNGAMYFSPRTSHSQVVHVRVGCKDSCTEIVGKHGVHLVKLRPT